MWTCPNCNTTHEDNSVITCWNCGKDRTPHTEAEIPVPELESFAEPEPTNSSEVQYRIFRGVLASFDTLFSQAAEFASHIDPKELISISHSEDKNDGVVTVWYWSR